MDTAGTPASGGLPRLELRVARLRVVCRFTYAFHAREVRFEVDSGQGFQRIFPETVSFHASRHDPAELYLQLEDLWTKPRLLSERATKRDAEEVLRRLFAAAPRHLERVLDRLEGDREVDPGVVARVYEDVTLLARIFARFVADKQLGDTPDLRYAPLHLRKLAWRSLLGLVQRRVRPESIAAYLAGRAERDDPAGDPSDSALLSVLSAGDPETLDRTLLHLAEGAFYRWLEDVCLDESNQAFEREGSPFGDREREVLDATSADPSRDMTRGRDLTLFLRRPGNRDCLRVLGKLETWFLRQYDVHHASVVIYHASYLGRGVDDADRILSRHSVRNYALALLGLASPFLGAVFAYERAPLLFDLACSLEVLAVTVAAFWFLAVRFAWKRDLTFFHTSVPRLGAGIIVGYLPVFLIDEVWDLALRATVPLVAAAVLFGFTTLLYLYVEVRRRIGDTPEAFARTRALFLLGLVQAYVLGLVATSLLGRFMALRALGGERVDVPIDALRTGLDSFAGELPRIVGVEPVLAFPTVILLMTFLSFFIGTFLQLLWEDLPITEPM
jgi:hypothetical protein